MAQGNRVTGEAKIPQINRIILLVNERGYEAFSSLESLYDKYPHFREDEAKYKRSLSRLKKSYVSKDTEWPFELHRLKINKRTKCA